ncbi:MAG: RNA 2',3'-cyclic phosphodiesterase [candidate division Zixibacteria bacterium]
MLRLFIALHLPGQIKEKLEKVISDLRPLADGIKWVEPKNMHLTLKFLGDTEEEIVEGVAGAVIRALTGRRVFEVKLSECGGFPNLKNPRVIWAGIDGADPAVEMAMAINNELAKIGIEKDKKRLSPHLTLGRIKRRSDLSRLSNYLRNLYFDSEAVILDRAALIKSTLTPRGPIYENLREFKLVQ